MLLTLLRRVADYSLILHILYHFLPPLSRGVSNFFCALLLLSGNRRDATLFATSAGGTGGHRNHLHIWIVIFHKTEASLVLPEIMQLSEIDEPLLKNADG